MVASSPDLGTSVLGAVTMVSLRDVLPAPSKASPNDDSGVTSVVSCSSTSPASGTYPASDVLTSGSEGLHAPLFTSAWELGKFRA